jgi:hypothetical protein
MAKRLHVLHKEEDSIDRLLSFDFGFDGYPGVTRLS